MFLWGCFARFSVNPQALARALYSRLCFLRIELAALDGGTLIRSMVILAMPVDAHSNRGRGFAISYSSFASTQAENLKPVI